VSSDNQLKLNGFATVTFCTTVTRTPEGYPLLPYAAHMLHIGPEQAAERLETLSRYHSLPENQNLATRLLDRKIEDTDFSDRYLQSSWSTLTGDMDPIITETVLRSLCTSDFTPEDILCGREMLISGKPERRPVTVYLRFPENRLLALSPLVRLIWSTLLDELIALYDQRHGAGCYPVLALIDEAGTSPIPGLPKYAATVAGRGITLEVMVQDHNQLEHAYGKYALDRLSTIWKPSSITGNPGLKPQSTLKNAWAANPSTPTRKRFMMISKPQQERVSKAFR
jgi:TraM recognition site of TraD and TraG